MKELKLENSYPYLTPMETNPKYLASLYGQKRDENGKLIIESDGEKAADSEKYRQKMGKVLWNRQSRPEISYANSVFSRRLATPTLDHDKGLLREMIYLVHTADMGLLFSKLPEYNGELRIEAYTDSNWGKEVDGKSTTGYLITLNGLPVNWGSRKQTCVALSSCEAEWSALATTIKQLRITSQLLAEIGYKQDGPIPIYCDNKGVIDVAKGSIQKHSRHFDMANHFIIDEVEKGNIVIEHIRSELNKADIFTKPLDGKTFFKLRDALRVCKPDGSYPEYKGKSEKSEEEEDKDPEKRIDQSKRGRDGKESTRDSRKSRGDDKPNRKSGGTDRKSRRNSNEKKATGLSLVKLITRYIIPYLMPLMFLLNPVTAEVSELRIGESVALMDTGRHVYDGMVEMELRTKVINLCDALDMGSIFNQSRTETVEICKTAYLTQILDPLERICPRDSSKFVNPKRVRTKRFAVTATVLVGVTVYTLLSAFTGWAVAQWWTSHTIEENRAEILKIHGLESKYKDLDEIENEFIRDLVIDVEKISKKVEKHEKEIEELRNKLPSYTYNVASVMAMIQNARHALKQAWFEHQNGKVSMEMLNILGVEEFATRNGTLDLAESKLIECYQDKDLVVLRYKAPRIQKDILLLEIEPFTFYVNETDQVCRTTYFGPRVIGHDLEKDCYYNYLEQEMEKLIFSIESSSCVEANDTWILNDSRHFKVETCVPEIQFDVAETVQVKISGGKILVYCQWNQIKMDGDIVECEDQVYKFDIFETFEINGKKYTGETVEMTNRDEIIENVIEKYVLRTNITSPYQNISIMEDYRNYEDKRSRMEREKVEILSLEPRTWLPHIISFVVGAIILKSLEWIWSNGICQRNEKKEDNHEEVIKNVLDEKSEHEHEHEPLRRNVRGNERSEWTVGTHNDDVAEPGLTERKSSRDDRSGNSSTTYRHWTEEEILDFLREKERRQQIG